MKIDSSIRNYFPILSTKVNNRPLVYFDNAATTQKPLSVIDSISNYYKTLNSNVHRGVHQLAIEATTSYERVRNNVRDFINAANSNEIIFTRGTTESLNLLANSFGELMNSGDNIIISTMEHHSNIVPWQLLSKKKNIEIRVINIDEDGNLDLNHFKSLIDKNTKLVSITHISNVLGTINPIEEIIKEAHRYDIPVSIDGAQAIPHTKIDVQKIDCDFYAFSGHKMYAPMGIGVLYGKEKYLEKMPPYQGGGEMIKNVSFEETTFNELPYKFEAGTPNVSDAIGLAKAIEFMNQYGYSEIEKHEKILLNKAEALMKEIGGIRIYGNAKNKAGAISFLMDNIHPYDAGVFLDKMGIAIRTGTHCAEPLMTHYGIKGTMRTSFAIYNTEEEIDNFILAIKKVKTIFEQ